jgi:hypothetical protein
VTPGPLALAPPVAASAAATESLPWRARLAEFLLVGGGTLLILPLGWLLRRAVGLDAADYAFGFATFYAAYVVNDPHFAVTYFLFYRDARRRAFGRELPLGYRVHYLVSGLLVPLTLGAWALAAIATHSAQALGWMVQLMYLLVGWHYVKQGFGVVAVLAARRGVRVTAGERRALLFHALAGWAFAWANPAMPGGEFEEKGVVYRALAHPRSLEWVTGGLLAISTVVLVAVLARRWRRERSMLPIGPLTGFLVTVWSWTIFSAADPLLQYAIPALHSIQYFYFVALLRAGEARAEEGPPTFGRPVAVRLAGLALSALALGWFLFRGAPSVLDAIFVPRPARGHLPDDLGLTPFFAAFFVFVNVHHYFMDHVLWRRETPETRFLRA